MKSKWMTYQELEMISTSESTFQQQNGSFKNLLGRCWRSLLQILSKKAEVEVWKTVDRSGNLWWNVYDPATGDSVYCSSETEVRMWLEQSYYR